MITFLPCVSFTDSAAALDRARLGKQRIEVKIILTDIYSERLNENIFIAEMTGVKLPHRERLRQHPARLMWEDYPMALVAYGLAICNEWRNRGYLDNAYRHIEAFNDFCPDIYAQQGWMMSNAPDALPPWLGDERLHASHRSNLIRKDREWYAAWNDPDDLPYFWPGRDYARPVIPA